MRDLTTTEDRALQLLGQGTPASVVAQALGVTEGRISQLLADEEFAAEVQERRFLSTQKFTALDDQYFELEEKLVQKLNKVMPLLTKPRDIVQAMTAVNNTKRRGAQVAAGSQTVNQQVVVLNMPEQVIRKFVSNGNNQVVEVRDSEGNADSLVTVTSGALDRLARQKAIGAENHENSKVSTSQRLPERSSPATVPEGSGAGSPDEAGTSGESSLIDYL